MGFLLWVIIVPGLMLLAIIISILHISLNKEFSQMERFPLPSDYCLMKKLINGFCIYFIIIILLALLYLTTGDILYG